MLDYWLPQHATYTLGSEDGHLAYALFEYQINITPTMN